MQLIRLIKLVLVMHCIFISNSWASSVTDQIYDNKIERTLLITNSYLAAKLILQVSPKSTNFFENFIVSTVDSIEKINPVNSVDRRDISKLVEASVDNSLYTLIRGLTDRDFSTIKKSIRSNDIRNSLNYVQKFVFLYSEALVSRAINSAEHSFYEHDTELKERLKKLEDHIAFLAKVAPTTNAYILFRNK